jgi:hypothetical protein
MGTLRFAVETGFKAKTTSAAVICVECGKGFVVVDVSSAFLAPCACTEEEMNVKVGLETELCFTQINMLVSRL